VIDARLQVALNGGGLVLPEEGRIAVFHPTIDADLDGIDPERVDIIHDFKPSFDIWTERGYTAVQDVDGRYAAAIVCLPRAKLEARAMIAKACAVSEGIVIIDGQ
jgi:16S rRNA (guanine1207-N2)-methyltransferase